MNSASDSTSPPLASPPGADHSQDGPQPSNWREALLSLVAARVALIQLESKEAAKTGARRLAAIIGALICAFFTWALLLAGGIAALADATGWPWYGIAVGASIIHLLAAIVLANTDKGSSTPPFPVTRAEFQKDREWIENLKKPRKSSV